MTAALTWHDEGEILGVRVRVHLFDAAAAEAKADRAARLLPLFGDSPPPLEDKSGESAGYVVGGLCAKPDAVFRHGDALICLVEGDGRPRDGENWLRLFRVDAMLTALAAAMAVAGECQRPTVALLRDAGALYQLDPGSAVLECLATHIGDACRHWEAPKGVSAAQLASFCEPKLRVLPGVRGPSPQPAAIAET